MKKLIYVFSLLVLLGTMGTASARELGYTNYGPWVAASISLPGVRFVFGHPGIYCWYGGRYYSRADWDRFNRERVANNRFHRDRFDNRDQGYHRDYDRH